MMRKVSGLALGLAAALSLAGCNTPEGQGAAGGAVIGGATGALLGAAITNRPAGALLGGVAGAATGAMVGSAVGARRRIRAMRRRRAAAPNSTTTTTGARCAGRGTERKPRGASGEPSRPTARSSPKSCPRPITASGAGSRGRTASSCTIPACRRPRPLWRLLRDPARGSFQPLFRRRRRPHRPTRSRGAPRLACRGFLLARRARHQFGVDRRRDRQSRPWRRPAAFSDEADRGGDRAVPRRLRRATRSGPSAFSPIPTLRRRASAIPARNFPGRACASRASAIGSKRRRRRAGPAFARAGGAAGARPASSAVALWLRSRRERRLRRAHARRSSPRFSGISARRGSTAKPTRARSMRCGPYWRTAPGAAG